MEYYFSTSRKLANALLFQDDEDFSVAMNYIAVVADGSECSVLGFVLMSNHFHFVFAGEEEQVQLFLVDFKRIYSRHYQLKYGPQHILRHVSVLTKEVFPEDEGLEKVLAYVLQNPVMGNISGDIYGYRWSSACCLFREEMPPGIHSSTLSWRECSRKLRTRKHVQKDLIINEYGYVWPQCYVPVEFVNRLFRSPKRLNYFLAMSRKAKARAEVGNTNRVMFNDSVVTRALPDMLRTKFGKESLKELSHNEMVELAQELKYRFNASPKQIARIIGLSLEFAERITL